MNIGNAEWADKDKNRILIMWRRPEEWAAQLYKWVCLFILFLFLSLSSALLRNPNRVQVSDNGQTDTVMTVWELQNSDEYKQQGKLDIKREKVGNILIFVALFFCRLVWAEYKSIT